MDSKHPINATCPECRGPLSEMVQSDGDHRVREFSCLVGHKFSPRTLLQAHSEVQERILWSAVVALEEATSLVNAVQSEFKPEVTERLRDQARKKMEQAQRVRGVLEQLEPFQTGAVE